MALKSMTAIWACAGGGPATSKANEKTADEASRRVGIWSSLLGARSEGGRPKGGRLGVGEHPLGHAPEDHRGDEQQEARHQEQEVAMQRRREDRCEPRGRQGEKE